MMYVDPTGYTAIRQLVGNDGSITWDAKTKIATVTINEITYGFEVNSDKTINLIKDDVNYGKFSTSEAKLIQYESSGKLVAYIDIEDNSFNKYFNRPVPNAPPSATSVPTPKPSNIVEDKGSYFTSMPKSIMEYGDKNLVGSAYDKIKKLDYLYGNLSGNDVPIAEAELIRTLDKAFSEQFGLKAAAGNVIGNSTMDALNTINKYMQVIDKVSKDLNVSKEMVESVLFREIRCFSPDDNADWLKIRLRGDASIGLGQVTISTAQKAEAATNSTGKSPYTNKQMEDMLWNDKTNIEYVGKVLKMVATDLNQSSTVSSSQVLAGYNGSGEEAQRYGNETMVYADAFTAYNTVVEANRRIK